MVELISKISKGTKMDQIYIPKTRESFQVGTYVVIKPLETQEQTIKPILYNIDYLEPIKVSIITEIFKNIDKQIKTENIIITGSFLDKGFKFNDIDVIIVSNSNISSTRIEEELRKNVGAKFHLIPIDNKTLTKGLSTDPLYISMLSRCVSKKRFIYRYRREVNYKLLDLQLLKSQQLIDNFDFSTGDEKYNYTRNLIAIKLFIENKEITMNNINGEISTLFENDALEDIKNNIPPEGFLKEYKKSIIT